MALHKTFIHSFTHLAKGAGAIAQIVGKIQGGGGIANFQNSKYATDHDDNDVDTLITMMVMMIVMIKVMMMLERVLIMHVHVLFFREY